MPLIHGCWKIMHFHKAPKKATPFLIIYSFTSFPIELANWPEKPLWYPGRCSDEKCNKYDKCDCQIDNLFQWLFHNNQIYSTQCSFIKRLLIHNHFNNSMFLIFILGKMSDREQFLYNLPFLWIRMKPRLLVKSNWCVFEKRTIYHSICNAILSFSFGLKKQIFIEFISKPTWFLISCYPFIHFLAFTNASTSTGCRIFLYPIIYKRS